MSSVPTVEGFLDYTPAAAGKQCQTWYKIHGNLRSGVRPLVVAHGGPGLSHDYMDTVADLAAAPYNLPVVFYDQIGGGRSTKLPERYRDYGFWNEQLFLDELTALLSHLGIQGNYDLLGNSWGGMLSSVHAARQPLGLKRLVLSGTPSSGASWCKAYHRYREQMPEPHRSILKQPRNFDTEDTPEYNKAIELFFSRHVVNVDPVPEGYQRSFEFLEKDPTVAHSTLGKSEFEFVGFCMTWSMENELHKISVPTLLINGVDEGADDESLEKFHKGIVNSKWVKFTGSTHTPHLEEREKFMKVVGEFLTT